MKKITKEEMAAMLNGREYPFEVTREEQNLARENNLVIIFGDSDDLCEMCGAINDEFGCFKGGEIKCGKFPADLTAVWNPEGKDCAWAYETEMPHSEFKIFEDGELYCIGIVADLNDAPVLKACPFCGKTDTIGCSYNPIRDYSEPEDENYSGVYAICETSKGGCGASSGWFETKKEAREAWNRRARI